MFDNKPIVLKGLSAAVFLARMKCVDENPWILKKQQWRHEEFKKSTIINKNKIATSFKPNPNYTPLTKEEIEEKDRQKAEADRFEDEWVYKYLKENYPNKDYVEIFAKNHNIRKGNKE